MSDERKTAVLNKLNETRQILLTAVTSITDRQWETAVFTEGSEWTAADVLRHLANAQGGMTKLMAGIQNGGDGVPADFDLAKWNDSRIAKVKTQTPAEQLERLKTGRVALLAFIETLADDDWDKKGRHATLKIMTIEEICLVIAGHEQMHANDIQTAVAA